MNGVEAEVARAELYSLLGELPARDRPIQARLISETQQDGYVVERLLLDLTGLQDVPALFVRPAHLNGRVPAVLYNHAHGNNYELGKAELLSGRPALQQPPFGIELTRRGYCALCIDHWAFGERRGRTESAIFKEMLWRGQVMWGMMVYETLRAFDYLLSRPEVDTARTATMGISMGSTLAWWAAALEPRIGVCVDLCCMTDYQALLETQGLDGHGLYYYVPRLLQQFDTARINTLIAPRPHLSLNGDYDPLTPPSGLERVDAALRNEYEAAGAPEAWRMVRSKTGHFETAAIRGTILDFLERWL